jgi:hypothetical protein
VDAIGRIRHEIDWTALVGGVLLVAPFMLVAAVGDEPVALRLGFLAVCLLIPAYKLGLPPLATLLHALATVAACALLFAAAAEPVVFVVAAAATAIGTIYLTRYGARLRTLGSFFFIPALYLACELRELPDGTQELGRLALLSPIAAGAVIAVEQARRRLAGAHLPTASEPLSALHASLLRGVRLGDAEGHWVTHAIAVFIGVLVAAAVTELFAMDERQWVIWSSVSVVTGDRREAVGKLGVRTMGVAAGAPLGLVTGWMLPQSPFVYSLSLVALLMTLVAIPRYPLAFTLRCFFTGLAAVAAGGSAAIAESRVENVILGGVIGVLALLVVSALRHEPSRQPRP